MQSLTELNGDEILHVLSYIPDACGYFSLLSTCTRIRDIALEALPSRWRGFYAHRFHFSEFELSITNPGLNWEVQLQNRLSKISSLKLWIADAPLQLPSSSPGRQSPSSNSMPGMLPMALSPVRTGAEGSGNRTNSYQSLEPFKAALVLLTQYGTLADSPIEQLQEKIRLILRYIEANGPQTTNYVRFRSLLIHFGLDIVASALAFANTLGSEYAEVQRLLTGVLFLSEMTSDLNTRHVRPLGVLLPLRYQLVESRRLDSQKLALSLLAKYNQHEETLNTFLPTFQFVAPLGTWLFDKDAPAVSCSLLMLSSIESAQGKAMVRNIPRISERIVQLLSWTSNMSVMSGSLAIIPTLDMNELIHLDILPILTHLVRYFQNIGLEGFALMSLITLEVVISSPASHLTITSTDILPDMLNLLKLIGDSIRHRHSIKAALSVIRALFAPTLPEHAIGTFSRLFRSLAGPSILQDMIACFDYTRRFSSSSMLDQLHNLSLHAERQDVTQTNAHREAVGPLVPVHDPGTLDHMDLVEDLYETLNIASLDLLSETCLDQNDSLEHLAADLNWVPFSILHHLQEVDLVRVCLKYLTTLVYIFPLSGQHQMHLGNLILKLISTFDPSCAPTLSLTALNTSSTLSNGPNILQKSIIIATALLQQPETQIHDDSKQLADTLAKFLITKRQSQQTLDATLMAPLMAFSIHAAHNQGIDESTLKILHCLLAHQLDEVVEANLELEFAMLDALVSEMAEQVTPSVKPPELIIPKVPLRFWISLEPILPLLNSSSPEIALIGLLGLSSFVSTQKGRKLVTPWISLHSGSIQLAQSRSIANSIFWKRVTDLWALFPDR